MQIHSTAPGYVCSQKQTQVKVYLNSSLKALSCKYWKFRSAAPTGSNLYFITGEKKSASRIKNDGNLSQQWWLIYNLSDGLNKQRASLGTLSLYTAEGKQRVSRGEAGKEESRRIRCGSGLSEARTIAVSYREMGSCATCEKLCLHGELMTLIYEECRKSSPLWHSCHSEPNFPCITFAPLR